MRPVVWAPEHKGGSVHTWALPAPAGSAALVSSYHHNTTTEIQPALQPPPQENQAMGFLPTGCPLSIASSSSLPAPLAPGESRISIACFSLTSFAVPSRLPFLLSSQARV